MMGEARTKRMVAKATDGSGVIELIWFKGIKFVTDKVLVGNEFIAFGKPSVFNGQLNVVHPEIDTVTDGQVRQQLGLQPYYNTTEKMKSSFLNSKAILKFVHTVFQTYTSKISETMPAYLVQKYQLMQLDEALRVVHFPTQMQQLEAARYRLKFEELFYVQLNISNLKVSEIKILKVTFFPVVGVFTNTFYANHLPFELTNAQKRVIKEIRRDMGSGRQMNRLLQGDVGSGKTLVALMVMLIAADNYYQSCLMAPTEILATQHFETIKKMSEGLGIEVALLTGSTKKSEREDIHTRLLSGHLHILMGTHALIEEQVQFGNLGLVVIDEQHRFGVAQRATRRKIINRQACFGDDHANSFLAP